MWSIAKENEYWQLYYKGKAIMKSLKLCVITKHYYKIKDK